MKTKLLTALLILTTIPFFAHKTPVQKLSNAELLAHLKNVRANTSDYIEDFFEDFFNEGNESIFMLNVINEFCNTSKFSQQYINHAVNRYLHFICNHKGTMAQCFYSMNFRAILIKQQELLTETDQKELYQLFESIYTSFHKIYCADNPNGDFITMTAHDIFKDISEVICLIDYFIIPKALIQKLDAKIAELACPSEALAE